jgi:hypothetical protein
MRRKNATTRRDTTQQQRAAQWEVVTRDARWEARMRLSATTQQPTKQSMCDEMRKGARRNDEARRDKTTRRRDVTMQRSATWRSDATEQCNGTTRTTRHSTTMQQPTEQADTERGKEATTRGKDDATRGEQRWRRYFFKGFTSFSGVGGAR